ncbi:MAG TPA: c-type cytochrome [Azospirillaceae bacterium]|nr:c-type cytochrome [Azospirillaceae bacterium]
MRPPLSLVVVALLATGCARQEREALDPAKVERGRALFTSCEACHTLRKRENRIGPHLVRIVGRAAGEARRYAYSPALEATDLAWTPENLRRYLQAPQAFMPGTNMAIAGYSPADAESLVEFLRSKQ